MDMSVLLDVMPAVPFFLSAARHLSFTRAAADLCVTQGAVSHRIRQLEEALGFPLFHRFPRRLALTGLSCEGCARCPSTCLGHCTAPRMAPAPAGPRPPP